MGAIPVDKLQKKTELGFQLKAFHPEKSNHEKLEAIGAHRDDHYLFFLMTAGRGSILVDFEEVIVAANQLYYILPEQIHYHIQTDGASGWFIAVDPSLVAPEWRDIFEGGPGSVRPVQLSPSDVVEYDNILQMISRKMAATPCSKMDVKVLHALLQAFISMAAGTMSAGFPVYERSLRPVELSKAFRKMLNVNIRKYRSPRDYARLLHVSEPYLNECLKKVTGSPVSFWIKDKAITEAKRLFYFSNLNVKQIANELGFEDHSYFSRLFIKETGMTALAFRQQFSYATAVLENSV